MLMKRIALGEKAALEELYKEMSKPVYYYALHLVGDPDTAEDVMQDTFVSVMRSSSSYDIKEKGRSWIFTIAKNKALDQIRKNRGSVSLQDTEDITDPSDFSVRSDSKTDVMKMLDTLSKKERDIVMLRLFGDMTLTEVSGQLGLPKGTVFWTYNNAIKKLKKRYTGGEENEK